MERKAKPYKRNIEEDESKPLNKNFYGKKVDKLVGVNKNKTVKKWQPNDDLNEHFNIDALDATSKRKTYKRDDAKNFSSDKRSNNNAKSYKKEDDRAEKKSLTKSFDKYRDQKSSFDNKPLREAGNSTPNRTYKEYKSSNRNAGPPENDFQETAFLGKKSIFNKGENVHGAVSKTTYKPKFKPEKKGPSTPRTIKDPNDNTIRLNKFISNAGICSRREADDLIKAGAVTVNGKVITEMGYKIQKTDLVNYGGQGLKPERQVYILLNKPKDYITTSDDPQERRTVLELIKGACKERVYPVGRLDRNTTGLLLLTNDGELTDKITHPSFKQKKIYHVELDKPVKKEHLKAIEAGIELEDGPIKVDEINYVENSESKKEVGITLHSGRNRIVRRIFEHFDYKVKKLDRVYFAGLTKKDLARGRWRFLTTMEVNMLKMVH